MKTPVVEPSVILDNYGRCALGARCECLKPNARWLGRLCPNWTPNGATTIDELISKAKGGRS